MGKNGEGGVGVVLRFSREVLREEGWGGIGAW